MPAILFLHGVGNTGAMWDRHAAALPEYRCIAPDLPGHGGSRAVRWQTRAATTDLVAALAEELVLGRPVHVVGLSLGGSAGTRETKPWTALVVCLGMIQHGLSSVAR